MNSLANKYISGPRPKNKLEILQKCNDGDIFVASVINQKAVNQNAQQILALVALQLINLTEAQFGFSTNDDSDNIFV